MKPIRSLALATALASLSLPALAATGLDSASSRAAEPFVARLTPRWENITDASGTVWRSGREYMDGRGPSRMLEGTDILGTSDDRLYDVNAFELSRLDLPVPQPGTYRVRLLFAEDYFRPGERVFDVAAEGRPVVQGLDLAAVAGKGVAHDEVFTVDVTDGTVNLGFAARAKYTTLSAAEITYVGPVGSSATTAPTPTATPTSGTPTTAPSPTTSPSATTSPTPTTSTPAAPTATPTPIPTTQGAHPGEIPGGGYVTGLLHGPDGQVFARTDVGGAYRWDASSQRWAQLLTPSSRTARMGASGVLALSTSASTSRTLLAAVGLGDNGGLIRSTDGGATWSAVGPSMYVHGNDEDRYGGSRLTAFGVDGVMFVFGSQKNGAMSVAADGTVTPLPLPGVPAAADVGAVAGDAQRGLWVGVNGVGLFRSADGRSFTKVASVAAGERYQKLVVTDAGTYAGIVAPDTTRRLVKVTDTGSRTLGNGWSSAEAFDVTPDGSRLIVIDAGTHAREVHTSTDGGTTWRRGLASFDGLDGTWASILPDDNWLSVGDVQWDPTDPGLARFAEGSGVWEVHNATTTVPTYRFASDGIQELVTNDVALTSQGTLLASWDRPVFLTKADTARQVLTTRFNSAWALATSPNDKRVVTALVDDRRWCCTADGLAQQSGMSFDGGLTWTRFPSLVDKTHPAPLRFGTLAVGMAATPTVLWEATDNAGVYRTTDRGRTWRKVISTPTGHRAYWLRRNTLVADPTVRGTFWHYQADGLKVSTTDGTTWTAVKSATQPPAWATQWAARLTPLPAIKSGLVLSSGHLDGVGGKHWITTDGGKSWRAMPGADGTNYVTALTEGTQTTLYTVTDDQQTIRRSTDLGVTWTSVPNPTPNYQPSDISDVVVAPGTATTPATMTVSFAGNTATTIPLPR